MGYRDNYEAWLRDFAEDEATIADLQAIAGDEKKIEDRFYKNLSFGTAGMRGVLFDPDGFYPNLQADLRATSMAELTHLILA